MLRDESIGVEAEWCGVESGEGHEEKCARLHRTLKRIVKARGALDAQEAAALREADALRLWRHYGYSSLLEYMEIEMGYSPRAALERLRVAKAIVDLPLIAEAMEQGDLSFSAGRELTRVATPETEQEWLTAADDKNLRQVEDLVSGHERGDRPTDPPDPSLRKQRLRYYDIDEETVALLRQAREILEREQGERLSDNAFLRIFGRMIVDGAASPERTRAPYQIAIMTCDRCKRGWQDGGGITVEMSPPTLEVALCDAQHIGSVESDDARSTPSCGVVDNRDGVSRRDGVGEKRDSVSRDGVGGKRDSVSRDGVGESRDGVSRRDAVGDKRDSVSRDGVGEKPALPDVEAASRERNKQPSNTRRAKSDIPPALRRAVRARDHGKCRVPWCRSSRNVDEHHIVPVSEGGVHSLENLISLCESHHIAHHSGALPIEGTASNPQFTRRAHNSFAIAERAVETAKALKALDFDKHEVKVAMEKTRTHVGTEELTLQQWIKIALSYCPKPRS